jgi:hypothetical protein
MSAVHLVSLAGDHVDMLPHMLAHYRSLGVDSISLNLHLKTEDDPVREEVEAIARKDGCGIRKVWVGEWMSLQQRAYLETREQYPNDWWILADQDELQQWPGPLKDVLDLWSGFDYIRGCFVDRISRGGELTPVKYDEPVWGQYPLGCWLTVFVLVGDPRKVVAAKGPLPLVRGQHHAVSGRGVPTRDCYVPVHHFKWTEGRAERLIARAQRLSASGAPQWTQSARFVAYLQANNGRINVSDPRLHVAECAPDYPEWEALKKFVLRAPVIL